MKPIKKFLLLIAFVCGISVMAAEISASRLLAPYFGTSLFVWTNIIGVVLAALSLGYYWGGKLAEKNTDLKFLLKLILAAGIFFIAVPWLISPVSQLVFIILKIFSWNQAFAAVFGGSLAVALLLFSFPLVLLGMTSPFLIKHYAREDFERAGEASGTIFAISTAGSILGVFLPTLWFIPTFGTRATISFFAVLLIILSSLGLFRRKSMIALLIFLFLLPVFVGIMPLKEVSGFVFEDESSYQYFLIKKDIHDRLFLFYNEGRGVQSVYDSKNILTGFYYDYFSVLPYLDFGQSQKKVLIIGLAGGTITRQLYNFFGTDLKIDGLEIDNKVIAADREYFHLDQPNLQIYNSDGRIFLNTAQDNYDFIFIDAYQDEIYVPWTLTTKEFWQTIQSHLNKNGVVAINFIASSPESEFYQAVTNTLASVFGKVYSMPVPQSLGWNYFVVAGDENLNLQDLPLLVKNEDLKQLALRLGAESKIIGYNPRGKILIDDRAPVEFLMNKMFADWRK